jgi:metallo-beta-lactamase family protein
MAPRLTFHGGAGTVTGSCYAIEHEQGRFLVDCGLFQGTKTVRELNYGAFPFQPGAIDFVLLTHAHIDHSGLLPKLHKHGFRGPIHATPPTVDLLSFMLPDSGHIQESEVERLNRRNRQRGRAPVEPIYTRRDAEDCLEQIVGVAYETWLEPRPGVRARFWNAGHILGSASIEVQVEDGAGGPPVRLLCSGDLGPDEKIFHLEPDAPAGFDYLVCESTYGDRDREDATVEHRRDALCREINEALGAGGNLLIPAFTVERTRSCCTISACSWSKVGYGRRRCSWTRRSPVAPRACSSSMQRRSRTSRSTRTSCSAIPISASSGASRKARR